MKGLKKLTAIILCLVMALTAVPMAAFAQEPEATLEPYIKIVFKNYEDKDILPGESVELYLDYEMGSNTQCKFDWFVDGAGTGYKYESAERWEGRPGIRVNTDSKLRKMDFTSTMAMSAPIENFIKANAPKPPMVVSEDAPISGIALLSAAIAASMAGLVSFSSEKRWHKMMA